jgi:hypothetical protein
MKVCLLEVDVAVGPERREAEVWLERREAEVWLERREAVEQVLPVIVVRQ